MLLEKLWRIWINPTRSPCTCYQKFQTLILSWVIEFDTNSKCPVLLHATGKYKEISFCFFTCFCFCSIKLQFVNRHLHRCIVTIVAILACTCNTVTLEAKFLNGVGSISSEGNCPSIGGWIVWPPVILHKERCLNKYRDLTET